MLIFFSRLMKAEGLEADRRLKAISLPSPGEREARRLALGTFAAYVLVGILWILYFDRLLDLTVEDPVLRTRLQLLKGWVFVFGSGALVSLLVWRSVAALMRSHAVLRESEAMRRATFEGAGVGLAVIDHRTGSMDVNPAMVRMLGYTREELHDLGLVAVTHPDDRASMLQALGDLYAGRSASFRIEKRCIRKDSSIMWANVTGSVVHNEVGAAVYTIGAIEDATDRRWAEEALRESEAHLRSLLKGVRAIVWECDVDTWGYTYISQGVEEILGYPVEQWYEDARLWENTLHPEDREWAIEACVNAVEARRDSTLEYRIIARDGRVVQLRDIIHVVMGSDGRPERLRGIMVDITEQKAAEEALRESESRFRALVENITEAVSILERDGTVRYVSPAFERITGFTAEEREGRSALEHVHPEDVETARREWQRLLEMPGQIVSIDSRIQHKDGRWRHTELVGKNLLEDPVVCGVVVTYKDVTERTSLEGQLRQAQKMEAIGRLAGGIAHDFNNLITSIRGYADLLMSTLGEQGVHCEDLQEISKAADRAAALTRQLLAFSRRQVLQPRVLDLNESVVQAERLLRRLIGEDIDLVTSLAANLGQVHADPGQMDQVIINLAVNARDAMPEGGRLVIRTENVELDEESARRAGGLEPGAYVQLAIEDTGCGIDPEAQSYIFEPFFTTKEEGKGTGLGLSTVYGIIKQSGGHIGVESEVGRGTEFRILLPRVEDAMHATHGSAGEREGVPTRAGETILVVEDETAVRTLIRRILSAAGYTVLEAPDAGQALIIAERHEGAIHLLLTDLVLPQMSGRSLAERLEAHRPDLRVLLTSGYTDDMIASLEILERDRPFLHKPFTPAALTHTVREVLDGEHALAGGGHAQRALDS